MIKVTSKDNTALKEYRKLCASGRYRRKYGGFALEGVRLICDYVKSGGSPDCLLLTESGLERLGGEGCAAVSAAKKTLIIDDKLASSIAETDTPQGAFAICGGSLAKEGLPQSCEYGALLLCSLQDPGNVGTILRSAEAFGLSAVIMTADCPDVMSPKVLRASMGAAMRLSVHIVPDAVCAIEELRSRGIPVYAAALGDKSEDVSSVSLGGAAVAVGNEGSGLSGPVAEACDKRVILPMQEGSESLNAAMAATVFAWELRKSSRQNGGGAK